MISYSFYLIKIYNVYINVKIYISVKIIKYIYKEDKYINIEL